MIGRNKINSRTDYCPHPSESKTLLLSIISWLGIIFSLLMTADLKAMPPYPVSDGKMKAGRVSEPYYLKNLTRLRAEGVNAPGDLLTKQNTGLARTEVSGNINILTILVDFSDKAARVPPVSYDTLIYEDITGTVTNYYKEVSYNKLIITTVVLPSSLGWKHMPYTYDYYCNGKNGLGSYPYNVQKLVENAVDAVDSQIDFSRFNNDGDNYVDGLIIIHSGPGAEITCSDDDIWSHKWSISPRLKDGVYINTYTMVPEYWDNPGDLTCGVFCHELGHVFGLPDLYDTENPSDSEGIGVWSLMAGGAWNGSLGSCPAHLDAWCKIKLGFAAPEVLKIDQSDVSIPAVENNASIFKLWTNGSPANEYFLVENRQLIGYDSCLPSGGLLIWHIDEIESTNKNQWWPKCGWDSHYKVALVQADNQWDMELDNNRGDDGDPFPGISDNRAFDVCSSPSSNAYSNSASNVAVINISNSDLTMTADMEIGIPRFSENNSNAIPNKAYLHQNFPNPFNTRTEIVFQLMQMADVEINIFDVSGRLIKMLSFDRYNAGDHKVFWDGTNQDNRAVNSGVYFCSLNIGDMSVYRKMLLLK